MLCVKCGLLADKDGFCRKHFLDQHELFSIGNIRMLLCDCGAYYDNKWNKNDVEKTIPDIIKKNLKSSYSIIKINSKKKRIGNRFIVTVFCEGIIKGMKKKEQKQMFIILKKRKCDNCVKLSGGYYEAVLQLRGKDADKLFRKLSTAKGISNIEKLREGYDIKFIKKSAAKRIAKSLNKNHDVVRSFSHAASKKGKRLYRDYYAVR